MFDLVYSARFFKDLKRCDKRGFDIEKLDAVILDLKNDMELDPKYKAHLLQGEFKGYTECHIEFDWLLIYSIDRDKKKIRIARTGTHSDLFS